MLKAAVFLVMFCLCTLPYSVSAYGSFFQDELNNSQTSYNITFAQNGSYETVYIVMDRDVNLTSASLRATGYSVDFLSYSAGSNTSAVSCGGSPGACPPNTDNWDEVYTCNLTHDGNWSSYGQANDSGCYTTGAFVTKEWPKPKGTTSAVLNVRTDEGYTNSSIIPVCWSAFSDIVRAQEYAFVSSPGPVGNVWILCDDDAGGYDHIDTIGFLALVYESAMYWNTTLYPENITIDVGDNGDYEFTNYTVYNSTAIIDLNVSEIHRYLREECSADWQTGTCDVPFNISSVTVGLLELSGINLTGEYLDTVGDCSEDYYEEAVYFWFDEEGSLANVNGSVEYVVEDINSQSSYNTTHTDVPNITICTFGNSTYTVNMTLIYWNESSDQRSYYFYHATMGSATPENITLYQIPSADSEKVEITVKDANDNTVSDVYVNIQRYYISENQYRTVMIGRTDSTGKLLAYLIPDTVFYKFTLSVAGTVSNTYSSMIITDTTDDPETLTLYTSDEDTQFFDVRENVGGTCYVNYTSNYTICSVADATGLITSARLLVEHMEIAGPDVICDKSDSGSAFTLSCFLGADANGTYSHKLFITPTPNPPYMITSGYGYFAESGIFTDLGLLPAFMLVLVTGMLALAVPTVAAIMAVVGLAAGVALDLIEISWASIVSLFVVAFMIFMRRGKG